MFTAMLGGSVDVSTLGRPVRLKIPAGTQSGRKFRLTGKGMPKLRAKDQFGDLYARVMVTGLVIVSVVAAVCLVSVGMIPFLGLIVPNVVSLTIGDNMRRAVPWVAVTGAAFVLACDLLGRVLRHPHEIPIGVIVGLVGSALFIWLLLRKRPDAG